MCSVRVFSRFLYTDQPVAKRWHQSVAASVTEEADTFGRQWEFYGPNVRGLVLGIGYDRDHVEQVGTVEVDTAGRLVYREGQDVRVLCEEITRKPVKLNLLPPEMRKPQ